YGIRRVGRAEAARIEPNLAEAPDFALHIAEEGAVEPAAAALALIADAVRRGAKLVAQTEVVSLLVAAGEVRGVETPGGRIRADEVVLAAGIETPRLAAPVGIDVPFTTPPGLLVHSQPTEKLLNGLVIADRHMRQTAEGRIVCGTDFGGADPGE